MITCPLIPSLTVFVLFLFLFFLFLLFVLMAPPPLCPAHLRPSVSVFAAVVVVVVPKVWTSPPHASPTSYTPSTPPALSYLAMPLREKKGSMFVDFDKPMKDWCLMSNSERKRNLLYCCTVYSYAWTSN
jgi:hypothetical protein